MKKTLKEIASLISGELSGDPKIIVKGVSSVDLAKDGDLTFAADDKSITIFEASKAAAAIISNNLKQIPSKPHIKVSNIRFAMTKVLALVEDKKRPSPGISKTASVAKSATIGSGVSVMGYSNIGERTSIGGNVIIYPGSYIGNDCKIGSDTIIHPNAVIYDRTEIGKRCVIHAGAAIGVDGFGFAPAGGRYEKIPQVGNVVIEDEVEIFANVCISRATMGSTLIKRGTKIDNLTHIAHNCIIGEDCAITALVAIAGSTELKDHVSIGGTSGVNDHITIGENTVVMGRSGVTKDIPANSVISGFPAQDHKKELEQQAAIRRLPRLIEKIASMEDQTKKH